MPPKKLRNKKATPPAPVEEYDDTPPPGEDVGLCSAAAEAMTAMDDELEDDVGLPGRRRVVTNFSEEEKDRTHPGVPAKKSSPLF